jgi:hypothetical protein
MRLTRSVEPTHSSAHKLARTPLQPAKTSYIFCIHTFLFATSQSDYVVRNAIYKPVELHLQRPTIESRSHLCLTTEIHKMHNAI